MGKATDLLRNLLCRKRINERKLSWVSYKVSRDQVVCFHLSTNPLLAFEADGKQYFFRECPPKQNRKTYIKEHIRRFFSYISNNQLEKINFAQTLPIRIDFEADTVAAFRSYIDVLQAKDDFIQKIGAVYETMQRNGYSIWAEDNTVSDGLFAQAGLEQLSQELYDIAVYFIWYMRGAMATLDTQKAVSGKSRYYYNAVRTVATEQVAKLLGLQELITPSLWCRLRIDGEERFGIASAAAPGVRAFDADVAPNGLLQRDLICLNILDVICFQQDHGPNNYNVDLSGNRTLCAFDNDNPNTFFPIGKISWPLSGCDPVVTAGGKWNRPYMDKALAEALMGLNAGELKAKLKPYLNSVQIKGLLSRVKQLQALLKDATLLSDGQWNEETLQEELSGKYGKTYLCHFAERKQV